MLSKVWEYKREGVGIETGALCVDEDNMYLANDGEVCGIDKIRLSDKVVVGRWVGDGLLQESPRALFITAGYLFAAVGGSLGRPSVWKIDRATMLTVMSANPAATSHIRGCVCLGSWIYAVYQHILIRLSPLDLSEGARLTELTSNFTCVTTHGGFVFLGAAGHPAWVKKLNGSSLEFISAWVGEGFEFDLMRLTTDLKDVYAAFSQTVVFVVKIDGLTMARLGRWTDPNPDEGVCDIVADITPSLEFRGRIYLAVSVTPPTIIALSDTLVYLDRWTWPEMSNSTAIGLDYGLLRLNVSVTPIGEAPEAACRLDWVPPPPLCRPVESVTANFLLGGRFIGVTWIPAATPITHVMKYRVELWQECSLLPGWWRLTAWTYAAARARGIPLSSFPGWQYYNNKVLVRVMCRDCTEGEGRESAPFGNLPPPYEDWFIENFELWE